MIYGANKPHNVALVIPDAEALRALGVEAGRGERSDVAQQRAGPPAASAARSRRSARSIKGYERVQNFIIALEDFTTDNGMLTPDAEAQAAGGARALRRRSRRALLSAARVVPARLSPRRHNRLVNPVEKAEVLLEALPYIRRFAGKVLVIKYGGHAMERRRAEGRVRAGRRAPQVRRHAPGDRPRRRAADRRRRAPGRASSRASCAACASPTRPPWRSSRRCWSGSINKEIVALLNRHGGARRRALGQGRRAGRRPQARAARSTSAWSATWSASTRRSSRRSQRLHPGDRAHRRRHRRRRPSTSTPTSWPARSPRRCTPRSSSCSPTSRA